jgi:hypothetical protein
MMPVGHVPKRSPFLYTDFASNTGCSLFKKKKKRLSRAKNAQRPKGSQEVNAGCGRSKGERAYTMMATATTATAAAAIVITRCKMPRA